MISGFTVCCTNSNIRKQKKYAASQSVSLEENESGQHNKQRHNQRTRRHRARFWDSTSQTFVSATTIQTFNSVFNVQY